MTNPDAVNHSDIAIRIPPANGAWIKMRTNLWDAPQVARICELLKCIEALVIGAMYRLWSLADTHSTDGRLDFSSHTLNRKVGVDGFSEAVAAIGWLEIGDGYVVVVRFDEHNGKSAKRRAQDASRQAKHYQRNATEVALTEDSRHEREKSVSKSKSKCSEEQEYNTHDSMPHESFRVSKSKPSEAKGIRFGQIVPDHVRRIVRNRDGPLFESYFADALQAGWAKDCEADRLAMAALFHQVMRIGRAKDPGRVINRSWKNRESLNQKDRLKLATADEDFARELLRPKPLVRPTSFISPMRSAEQFQGSETGTQDRNIQTQIANLRQLMHDKTKTSTMKENS